MDIKDISNIVQNIQYVNFQLFYKNHHVQMLIMIIACKINKILYLYHNIFIKIITHQMVTLIIILQIFL